MSLPLVAIVGRPNVGKSSLFNWLAGRRISIVEPTAGVTRDRIDTVVQYRERFFELVDTGGMGIQDIDNLTEDVERQIRHAIDAADVVVFVVDIRDGVVPLDEEVAVKLRTVAKPVVFVANKADTEKLGQLANDFFSLGYGEPILVSAEQFLGKEELFDEIFAKLPPDMGDLPPIDATLKIAIVGRPNVGKSTFINCLANTERVIVSEIPGTTRDSIDVRFERDGKTFMAIDTAGVKKKTSQANSIEFYSAHRAERSIRRSDVVLHFFDARHRIGRVDKQLAGYILDNHKPAVFVVNKWDLVKTVMPTEKMGNYVRAMFPMLEYVPIAFISANKGKNVLRLLQLAIQLHKQSGTRITTGDLNRVVRLAVETNAPPMRNGRQPKVFYATQITAHPPTIVLFTNGPELFDEPYIRYLMKVLRDSFPFAEVAIKLILRARGEGGGPAQVPPSEESALLLADGGGDEEAVPIVRRPAAKAAVKPKPVKAELADEPKPRPRPKKKGSETWDL